MPATIIMGGQWGDEGKGKLTDALAGRAKMVVRANGGSNAGSHGADRRGTFKMHLVPSGILNPDCECVIGAGVVLDPVSLLTELDGLRGQGIGADHLTDLRPRARRAPVSRRIRSRPGRSAGRQQDRHDLARDRPGLLRQSRSSWTTGRRPDRSRRRRQPASGSCIDLKNRQLELLYDAPTLDADAIIETYREAGERLRPYVCETEPLVYDALSQGQQVLVECAQGAMLDIDYGTYPFVTSSSPSAAGACQGAGIAPTFVRARHRRLQGLQHAGRRRPVPDRAPRRDRPV